MLEHETWCFCDTNLENREPKMQHSEGILGLASILAGIIGGIFSVFKSLQYVEEGERGALLTFGRFKRILEPGFILVIPFVHKIVRIHIRQTTTDLPTQTITLADGLAFRISGMMNYKVHDVYKALFEIIHISSSLKHMGLSVIRQVMSKYPYKDITDLERINSELLKELKKDTETWGVEIISFRITDLEPVSETSKILGAKEAARAQVEANDILLKHLSESQEEMMKISPQGTGALSAALLLRNHGGVPTFDMGIRHEGGNTHDQEHVHENNEQ